MGDGPMSEHENKEDTVPFTKADEDKLIFFPHTGSWYKVLSVDVEKGTLTFGMIGDPEDASTSNWQTLRDIDVEIH
jgi:hypothetical protein